MPDSINMFAAARGLPEQFAQAVSASSPLDGVEPRSNSSVLIAGMGGSGIVGDLVSAVAAPFSPLPIVTIKSDECPAFVDHNTLVLIVSFSGETSESISVMTDALASGASVVTISCGGKVADIAASSGATSWIIDASLPCPRSGLAALAVPALRTLDHFGVLAWPEGQSLQVQFAATQAQLETRRADLDREDSLAVRLARRIGRTMPLIYGAGPLGTAAAVRWKSQFNENPKVPAFVGSVPELTHNEICGWAQHGDMTRQVLTLVQLRHSFEGDRNSEAMKIVGEITEEVVAGVHEVTAEGEGMLAQFFDLAMIGDFVTLHHAFAEGIDPGPVPVLEDIKERLR